MLIQNGKDAMCLDFESIQDVFVGKYKDEEDYDADNNQFFYYHIEFCGEEEQQEISCLSDKEREQWLISHEIEIVWYQVQTRIDYSQEQQENVLVQRFVEYTTDFITLHKSIERKTVLLQHETVFEDSIIDPFESQTHEINYVQINEAQSKFQDDEQSEILMDYIHYFVLDVDFIEEKRVRYSLWNVLGDVGGFHDGLVLLIRILIAPFAAYNFFFDLIKKSHQQKPLSEK